MELHYWRRKLIFGKSDKDFESDKFTLLGSDQTKTLVQDYIRKLEREFYNEQ